MRARAGRPDRRSEASGLVQCDEGGARRVGVACKLVGLGPAAVASLRREQLLRGRPDLLGLRTGVLQSPEPEDAILVVDGLALSAASRGPARSGPAHPASAAAPKYVEARGASGRSW